MKNQPGFSVISVKFLLLSILIFLHSSLYGENPLQTQEDFSRSIVYMEFQGDYQSIPDKDVLFREECGKQNINIKNTDQLVSLYLDDRSQSWQLGFCVEKPFDLNPPLKTRSLHLDAVITGKSINTEVESFIQMTKFQHHELGLFPSGPMVVKWLDPFPERYSRDAEIEVLFPVYMIGSSQYMLLNLLRFVVCHSIIIYLIISIFLLLYKKEKSHIFFSMFLVALALSRIDWILGAFRYTAFMKFPHLYYFSDAFNYLMAPSLFFFVLSALKKHFQFKKQYIIHFGPFLYLLLIWIFRFFRYSPDMKRHLILSGSLYSGIEPALMTIFYHVQTIGYASAALVMLILYQKEVKNQFASIRPKQFGWLYFGLIGFLVLVYVRFLKHALYRYLGVYSEWLYILSILCYLVYALIVLFYLIKYPELFSVIDEQLMKARKPSLSDAVLEKYKIELIQFMREFKPYLIPNISIQKLSEMVSIPPRSLSEVINSGFNKNFFEFINDYRIQEAKKLIVESDHKKTILEILFEVGYNNKSVFNATFKRFTGQTPTEFKLQVMRS